MSRLFVDDEQELPVEYSTTISDIVQTKCENNMLWSGQHLEVIWMLMLEDLRIAKHNLQVHSAADGNFI